MNYDKKVRDSAQELLKQKALFTERKLADVISEYAEDFVGILNKRRQFVIVNDRYFNDHPEIEQLFGLRPGEAFGCIHCADSEYGCGNGPSCGYCEINQTLIDSITASRRVSRDGHLLVNKGEYASAIDVRVTAVPFEAEATFIILFIKDISFEKRMELLERTFFHDVLNTSHTLSSLVSISQVSSDVIQDAEKTIEANVADIVEQIQYYQKLKFAEEGDLCPEKTMVNLSGEVCSIVESVEVSPYSKKKVIETVLPDEDIFAQTDRVLYRRIILNLLKNALEASAEGEAVSISLMDEDVDAVVRVSNSAVMSEHVRSQIFQRSFSTKGPGRGIGTYSVKLLGERYLDGKVDFYSDEENGTVFSFRIPRR